MITAYTPLIVRERIRRLVDDKFIIVLTPGTRGRLIGTLDANYRMLGIDAKSRDYFRRMLFCFLFADELSPPRQLSSKELSDAQWSALYRWIVGVDGNGRIDAQRHEQWLCHSAVSVMITRATVQDALDVLRRWRLPDSITVEPGDDLSERILRLGAAALSAAVMESLNESV